MSLLPPEIWAHIFSYYYICGCKLDTIELVCKFFRNIVRDHRKYIVKFTLMTHQESHYINVQNILIKNVSYLDTSPTGCGKTFVAMQVARKRCLKIMVIAPSSVCTVWEQESYRFFNNVCVNMSYEKFRGVTYKGEKYVNHPYLTIVDNEYKITEEFRELVQEGVLVVFDEVHRLKNSKTATIKACHELVKAIKMSGSRSRVALLSASPFDKPEHAESMVKMLGIVDSKNLYTYDRATRTYVYEGFQELINKCMTLNDTETLKYIPTSDKKDTINKGCYNMLINIVKSYYTSAMIKGNTTEIDAKNGYYDMLPRDQEVLDMAYNQMANAVNYNPLTGEVDMDDDSMATVFRMLVLIEKTKLNTIVRLIKEIVDRGNNDKIVVYLAYKDSQTYIRDRLEHQNIPCVIMNGTTTRKKRTVIINDFQRNNLKLQVLITTAKVGGSGISLDDQHGDYPRTILAVPNYMFIDLFQACGRINRTNTKSVATIRFIYSKFHMDETKILNALVTKARTTKSILRDDSEVRFPGDFKEYREGEDENEDEV